MQECSIQAQFFKGGMMRYVSHLDMIRFLYRALRRADLPFCLTQGFSPHPKVQFGQALKLGLEGIMEVRFFFRGRIPLEEFRRKLEQQLTEGIKVHTIRYGD
jgi:radical SAM-linked protein